MNARAEAQGDDGFFQVGNLDFDEISIMPVSCINYHNGHMIKFQFFEKSNSLNCHFKNLGTFVVSISHYMRAYFNYKALEEGNNFELPGDVGFLNCVMLKETADAEVPLYAKIGCQHRDTYTSTKLQLSVYKDAQCSQPYGEDGDEGDELVSNDGYNLNGYFLSNKVSFRPPFYSCQSCLPDEISGSFTKRYTAWYDDDYISKTGQKQNYDDANGNYAANDDAGGGSYYQMNDDTDNYANDDANDDNVNYYVNNNDDVQYNYKEHDDDFYKFDDAYENRQLRRVVEVDASHSLTAGSAKMAYQEDFDQEMTLIHRQLEQDGDLDDVASVAQWNMCERVTNYGMWCDSDCQSLDTFRVDEWSRSDVFLLVIMCVFMGAMMLLVFAKRVKAYERAAMWGDEAGAPNPGLPPCAMLLLFGIVFTVIVTLAALKFVNETLVFSVVTCVLLFIYMLKLTLFENRKQVFLPARSTRNHALKEPFYT